MSRVMGSSSSPSRWCPTPEQVMILEEIYKNGLKTPNATQIQHITSHLSLYGKIEGKNVFYWFQNHKARDRQKLRRKLYKHFHQHHLFFKRHRFDDHMFFQYFLLHHHHHQQQLQRVPQLLPLPTGSFHQIEGEEGSVRKVEGGGRTWCGGDAGMTATENEDEGEGETTCRNGTLRTLELFPVRGSWVKGDEEESENNGNYGG